jgi:hypothetical protein
MYIFDAILLLKRMYPKFKIASFVGTTGYTRIIFEDPPTIRGN